MIGYFFNFVKQAPYSLQGDKHVAYDGGKVFKFATYTVTCNLHRMTHI